MTSSMDKIPDVDTDGDGDFKYILVKLYDVAKGDSKLIVRGYKRCSFHADIFDEILNELEPYGSELDTECLGGGRISIDEDRQRIRVYGFSVDFGPADHQISASILRKKYPDPYVVEWVKDGV